MLSGASAASILKKNKQADPDARERNEKRHKGILMEDPGILICPGKGGDVPLPSIGKPLHQKRPAAFLACPAQKNSRLPALDGSGDQDFAEILLPNLQEAHLSCWKSPAGVK